MTEDEKFVKEHWIIAQWMGKEYVWPVPLQVGYGTWADAAEFTRQRLEEIRQTQEGIDILSRARATGNTNAQLNDCARAIARILAREQEILASLRRGMKEPQP